MYLFKILLQYDIVKCILIDIYYSNTFKNYLDYFSNRYLPTLKVEK